MPWLLFAISFVVCSTGLCLQVQLNAGASRPVWLPDVEGVSTVVLFSRLAASIALTGILILALKPGDRKKSSAGWLSRCASSRTHVPQPALATVRENTSPRRARDIIAARTARENRPA
jgi:hypothetical protein